MAAKHQIAAYPVRLEPGLRAHLQKAADNNDRSLHREIVRRLEGSVQKENAPEAATSDALVQ